MPCRAHACQVEVPVEVIREVVKTIEVPVEVIVEKKVEVEKTVTVEVPVQIIREGAHSRPPIACSCDWSLVLGDSLDRIKLILNHTCW